jgi:undecaprenyl-diphosphatase
MARVAPLSRLASVWRGGVAWFRRLQASVLVAGFAITLCLLVFAAIAHEVREDGAGGFDRWAVAALRDPADPSHPRGPAWLQHMGRDVTALGSSGVLVFAVLVTVVGLAVGRRPRSMWFILGATVSGLALNLLMKGWFSRVRPEFAKYAETMGSTSFPSGHSMNAAIVYLTLGTFVSRLMTRRSLQVYVFAASIVLTFAIAFSRVYLGAHYPTDVIAGCCAGFAWALAWWLVAEVLAHRRAQRLAPGPIAGVDDAPAAL